MIDGDYSLLSNDDFALREAFEMAVRKVNGEHLDLSNMPYTTAMLVNMISDSIVVSIGMK